MTYNPNDHPMTQVARHRFATNPKFTRAQQIWERGEFENWIDEITERIDAQSQINALREAADLIAVTPLARDEIESFLRNRAEMISNTRPGLRTE